MMYDNFNVLHSVSHITLGVSDTHASQFVYKVIGILWDIKALGSHILKTNYPIAMKFIDVM